MPAKVERPDTLSCWVVKFVADVIPNVEIPEILNAVPTRLLAIVIVAPTPDAVATILPPTKFRLEILNAIQQ